MTDHKSSNISSNYHLLLKFLGAALLSLSQKSKHECNKENNDTKHVQRKSSSTFLGYVFFQNVELSFWNKCYEETCTSNLVCVLIVSVYLPKRFSYL